MRAFRVVVIVLGALFVVLAISRLTAREIDRTGLCGSIVQGSTWDDAGASTHDCTRLRHDDAITAAAFFGVAVVLVGSSVGAILYTRRERLPATGRPPGTTR